MTRFALLLLVACSSDAPVAEPARPETTPIKQTKPQHEVMAEKLIAAIVADDVEQLRPLFGSGWADLGDLMTDNIRQLRSRLDKEKLDLAKSKIVRVDHSGDQVDMVDVHLEFEGRKFRTHYSAIKANGNYQLLGVANWIKLE